MALETCKIRSYCANLRHQSSFLVKLNLNIGLIQEGGMETDDLHSEVSKLQLMIQEEDNKMQKYKVEQT